MIICCTIYYIEKPLRKKNITVSITAQIFKDKLNIKIMKSFLKEYSYFK